MGPGVGGRKDGREEEVDEEDVGVGVVGRHEAGLDGGVNMDSGCVNGRCCCC